MPDQNRELVVTIKGDPQSFYNFTNQIRTVIAEVEKLGRTLNNINFGGGGGNVVMGGGGPVTAQKAGAAIRAPTISPSQGGGLAGVFVEAAGAMKNLGNVSRDSLRLMSDSVSSGINQQRNVIKSLEGDLTQLILLYDKFQSKATDKPTGGEAVQAKLVSRQVRDQHNEVLDQIATERQELVRLKTRQTQIDEAIAGGPPPTERDVGGPSPTGRGIGGGWGRGVMRGAAVAGAVAATIGLVGHETMGLFRDPSTVGKMRADVVRKRWQGILAGDWRLAFMMRPGEQSDDEKMDMYTQTGGLAQAEQAGLTAKGVLGAVGGPLTAAIGVGGGPGREGLTGSGMLRHYRSISEAQKLENALAVTERQYESVSRLDRTRAWEMFQSEAESRARAQIILGIAPVGTIPLKEMLTPTYKRDRADMYNAMQRDKWAREYGLKIPEREAAALGMFAGGGKEFARANQINAALAQKAGLTGFDALLTTAGRASGSNRFAFGAVGGGIEPNAGILLGQAILGSGFDPMGTTGGQGLLAAMQAGGFGWGENELGRQQLGGHILDFNRVQQAATGMQLMDKMLSGGIDSYQRGRNLVAAMGIKPGADVYTQDYLAGGMNFRQMVDAIKPGGKLPDLAVGLGITPADIRAQIGEVSSSVLAERMPGIDPNSIIGQQYARWQASNKDLPAFLSGLTKKDKQEYAKYLGSFTGVQLGETAAAGAGAFAALGGIDSPEELKLGGVGVKLKGLEEKYISQEAELRGQASAGIAGVGLATGNLGVIEGIIQAAVPTFKALSNVPGQIEGAATAFIKAMDRIIEYVNQKTGSKITIEDPTAATAPSPSFLEGKRFRNQPIDLNPEIGLRVMR